MNVTPTEKLRWFIGRVAYNLAPAQWVKGQPCLFFHPEGNSNLNLVGFVDLDEEQASMVCFAHNGRIRRGEQVMFDKGIDLERKF